MYAAYLPHTYANQVHNQTFTGYKKDDFARCCCFKVSYWPLDTTCVLLSLNKGDVWRDHCRKQALLLHAKLAEKAYATLNDFLFDNHLTLLEYLDVIWATLQRPTVSAP